jgi:hypothetical protein
MKIRVDTNEISYKEIDSLVQELREIRARKAELRSRMNEFRYLITALRNEAGVTFVSKHTGEVLNPDDWEVYDEVSHAFYHESNQD